MNDDKWFYAPDLDDGSPGLTLSDEESRHASGARRLRTGDPLVLFDGKGLVADGRVTEQSRRGVVVECSSRRQIPRPRRSAELAVAVPGRDRQGTLLEMATQLGAGRIAPIECERSTRPGDGGRGERWRRILVSACKQCRRPWLPELDDPLPFHDYLAAAGGAVPMMLCDPDGDPLGTVAPPGAGLMIFLVGPEGGFTDQERKAALDAGARPVSLSPHVLRIETAVAAALAAWWQLQPSF